MKELEGGPEGGGRRIALIASRVHQDLVDRLVEGARRCLLEHGVEEEGIELIWVPGAVEIPLGLEALADRGGVDAVVTLGVVLRGETPHFDHVAEIASQGIAEVARRRRLAVSFGVLLVDSREQGLARSGGSRGNAGREAAETALRMAELLRRLRSERPEGDPA